MVIGNSCPEQDAARLQHVGSPHHPDPMPATERGSEERPLELGPLALSIASAIYAHLESNAKEAR